MTELDRNLFLLINSSYGAHGFIALCAYVIAKYLIFAIPTGIVVLWITGAQVERRLAFTLFFALMIATLLSATIGTLFPVERPFIMSFGDQLLDHRPSSSFPSNHGLIMFCCAWVLLFKKYKWQAAVVAFAGLWVAWARIYLGIHWPSDMIGAVLIANAAALIAILFDHRFGEKLVSRMVRFYKTVIDKTIEKFIKA